MAIHVSAADSSDVEGGYELLWQAKQGNSARLELIRADQAYAKLFKQAASYYHWEVDTMQRLPSQKVLFLRRGVGRWSDLLPGVTFIEDYQGVTRKPLKQK